MKIFATDFDNTLLINNSITQKDIQSIKNFRNRGNLFGIVTGRALGSIMIELEHFDVPYDFIVGVNGGFAIDNKGNALFDAYINKQTIYEIIDYFDVLKPLSYLIHNGHDIARVVIQEDFEIGQRQIGKPVDEILSKEVAGFFTHYKTEEEAHEAALLINQRFPDVHAHININYVDITSRGISKAKGLAQISKHYDLEDIWAMGDAQNDMSMIQAFNSFAVEHAYDDLKKEANYVVRDVAEALTILGGK